MSNTRIHFWGIAKLALTNFVRSPDPSAPSPDDNLLHLLDDVTYQPIILISEHRSGSTMMTDLLAATNRFNFVNAYTVMRHRELLANHVNDRTAEAMREVDDEFSRYKVRTRGMDNVPAGAESALDYVTYLHPATGRGRLSERNFDAFDRFCKKVHYIGKRERPLLLKNCTAYSNPTDLLQYLPRARFIFLHRDPMNILASQFRILQSGTGNEILLVVSETYRQLVRYNINRLSQWCAKPKFGVNFALEIISRVLRKRAAKFIQQLDQMDPSAYVSLRYEDLMARPNDEINRVLTSLELEPAEVDIAPFIQPRNIRFDTEIESRRDKFERRLEQARERFGYLE